MTGLGKRTEREFIADFPIDFGSGHRGSFIHHRNEVVGIIETHEHPTRDYHCGGAVYWKDIGQKRPIWTLISLEPLTLKQSIQCACGAHGHIRDGQWQDVE